MPPESYSVAVFVSILALFLAMHLQMRVIVTCIRHKPAVLITLRDLVRRDLALAYRLSVSAQSAGVAAILIRTPETIRCSAPSKE